MKKKFRFLAWRLEIRLSKLHGDERILFLANKLIDETEANGYTLQGANCGHMCIWIHNAKQLFVESPVSDSPFRLGGKRTSQGGCKNV